MQYNNVWDAVDKLAEKLGISPSGLARKAGLDATTFNKSKRVRPDGKNRWPSLDSISKILEVSGLTFEQFYHLSSENDDTNELPLVPFAKFSKFNFEFIENDAVNTNKWKKINFPDGKDNLYALELDCNDWQPVYHLNSVLIISKNSEMRSGDRIIIFAANHKKMIYQFIRRTTKSVEVCDVNNPQDEKSIPINDIILMNRIIWASQ